MKAVLCKSRHTHPDIENLKCIFDQIDNPVDFADMEVRSAKFVKDMYPEKHLDLYVTGLTPALIAVLNTCKFRNVNVSLFHYDIKTNSYKEQYVF